MDGLLVDFDEDLASHASASYEFGRMNASRMHSRWLLDIKKTTMVSFENIRCSYVALKKPGRYPYDLTFTNDVRRSNLSVAFNVR